MSFIEEVKQSKAFKLIASYLGICFVILQVLDPLAERGIIEESLFRIIIYLIIAGIPIPLVVGFFSDRERVKLLNKKPNLNVINENLKQSIARYKHPKKIIIVKQLPRNAMGKVQKNILRSEFKSLFTE